MMNAILDLAERKGIRVLGLDATDLGQPVYAKRGFVPLIGIDRWTGAAQPRPAPADRSSRTPIGRPS